jgi:hypothetical protein
LHIAFIFTLLLNLLSCLILIWSFYNEHKQFRIFKKSKNNVQVYNPSFLIADKKLTLTVFAYVVVVTTLWILLIFGISDIVYKHWFAYVFPIMLITIFSGGKINYSIGSDGVYHANTVIPWEEIVCYQLKETDPFHTKFTLDIHTKHQVLRGIVPADSKTKLLALLQNVPSEQVI